MKALARCWHTIMGVLRALSDEDAYARYRAQHGLANSAATWRRFCDEKSRRRCDRARCC